MIAFLHHGQMAASGARAPVQTKTAMHRLCMAVVYQNQLVQLEFAVPIHGISRGRKILHVLIYHYKSPGKSPAEMIRTAVSVTKKHEADVSLFNTATDRSIGRSIR